MDNLQHSFKGRILVTGGAGFIGSALIWALNKRNIDNILVCDFLGNDERFKNLVPLSFADYIEADKLIDTLDSLNDVRTVFHLGACSSTTENDASYLIRNNYEYTKTLAAWALRKHARFVYASSAATYGDGEQGMRDDEGQLTSLRPLNMYAYSKHLFDLYAKRNGFLNRIYGLKYFNVFGPNESHKGDMRSLVNKAFPQIRDTGRVRLFKSYNPQYTDGGQLRDFLYVKDAVEMTLHFGSTDVSGGVFNLGSGVANSWIELVTPIFKALNLPVNIDFIDMPESIRNKYQYFTRADISKLRQSGYDNPIMPLVDAVTDYVKNYLVPDKSLS
ncbi:MAG: ADP-glyceromanno-heptose 6-epimerase [Verrucomicrobia bacterium GWF2_51_19]|nr:MAG: ADP-glyceromanno-heptose 6-epimerase [Verrucomicrobia bacterium GWF2_51_19]HCJ12186.1 ADP-glyceromanno-heptose 6-epimerase [Opitutae bacterium]